MRLSDTFSMRPLVFLALLFVSGLAGAALITVTSGEAPLPVAVDFEGYPFANQAGTLTTPGGIFGERFSGQTPDTSTAPGHELVSGTPTGPLEILAASTADQNLRTIISTELGTTYISGLLNDANTGNNPLTTGMISVLFGGNIRMFGIDLVRVNGPPGQTFLSLFDRNGVQLTPVPLELDLPGPQEVIFPFTISADARVIAGFTITTTDLQGIGIDNLRVPTSGSISAVLLGLVLLAGFTSRARGNQSMGLVQ